MHCRVDAHLADTGRRNRVVDAGIVQGASGVVSMNASIMEQGQRERPAPMSRTILGGDPDDAFLAHESTEIVAGHPQHEGQVHVSTLQRGRQLEGGVGDDLGPDAGISPGEVGQGRGQQGGGEIVAGADPDTPRDFLGTEAVKRFLLQGQYPAGVIEQGLSLRRRTHGTGAAFEHRDAERVLQPADVHADGGLCQPDPVASAGETPRLDHRDEGMQQRGVKLLHGSLRAVQASRFFIITIKMIRFHYAPIFPTVTMRRNTADREIDMTDWQLSQTFEHPSGQVRYGILGDGPPLVLMHGTPFSSYEWHRIAHILARSRRVYLYDMPGYGQSEKREGQDVSLAMQTVVFVALLAHWGLERPEVLAHDFGGTISLRAHLLKGVDYKRLLLVNPVAARPVGSPFVRHIREHEAAFAGVPDYLQRAIVSAYIRTAIVREMPDEELEPYVAPWTGETGKPAIYRQVAQMDEKYTDEIKPELGRMRCPVSLLWGEDDGWIPLENAEYLARALNAERFRLVPRAGHLVQEDAPEAIVGEACAFFDLRG